jgi:hypothetical protein
MARATGINGIAGAHPWAPHGQPTEWWLRRLTIAPPRTFLYAFGAALVVALVGARRITGANRLWLVATASCLLMLWFGSASSDKYVPLPLNQWRMLFVALPGVLVLAGLASETFHWRRRWIAPVVVALVAVVTVVPTARVIKHRALPDQPEHVLFGMLRDRAAAGGEMVIVCTDWRCLQAVRFYSGFHPPANVHPWFVTEFASAPAPTGARVYAVVDPGRASGNLMGGVPVVKSIEALGLPTIFRHPWVSVYDAGDGGSLHAALHSLQP